MCTVSLHTHSRGGVEYKCLPNLQEFHKYQTGVKYRMKDLNINPCVTDK